MTTDADDIVKVATGTLAEVEAWGVALRSAGIECRVVGGYLTAGLGTAIPGSAELWVHSRDRGLAAGIVGGQQSAHYYDNATSDPTPVHTRG